MQAHPWWGTVAVAKVATFREVGPGTREVLPVHRPDEVTTEAQLRELHGSGRYHLVPLSEAGMLVMRTRIVEV